jgi:hypothetical protein
MLVAISTPYRKTGLLYTKHRDQFSVPSDDVLCVQGSSQRFNETVTDDVLASQREADPVSADSEWDARFRTDVSAFLDEETIERALDHGRPLELPPSERHRYRAFVDASGGRHDCYTIAIGHKEGDRYIVDVIRGARPPFDPNVVTQEFAALCREYGVGSVIGDSYGAEWVQSVWRQAGMSYQPSDIPKSQIYLETLPLWTRGLISMPDHKALVRELRLLERHTHRSGKNTVDHGRNGSDDHANAVCGLLRTLVARAPMRISESVRQWAAIPPWHPRKPRLAFAGSSRSNHRLLTCTSGRVLMMPVTCRDCGRPCTTLRCRSCNYAAVRAIGQFVAAPEVKTRCSEWRVDELGRVRTIERV